MGPALDVGGGLYARFVAWQWALCALHYIAAVAVVGLLLFGDGGDWEVPVHLTYNVWERLNGTECSKASPCLVSENRAVLPRAMSVGWTVATFSVFSGTHHLFMAAPRTRGTAAGMIEAGVNPVRWADYACSASAMLMVNSIMWVAPPDLQALVLWFSVQFLVICVGYGSEVAWAKEAPGHAVALYCGAMVAYAAVWSVAWAAFQVSKDGHAGAYRVTGAAACVNATGAGPPATNDPPTLVYVLLVWLCASFLLFPVVHALKLRTAPGDAGSNLRYEVYYGFLSLFSKIPLLCVYMVGVLGRADNIVLARPANFTAAGDDNTYTTPAAIGASGGASLLLGVALFADLVWCKGRHARARPTARAPGCSYELLLAPGARARPAQHAPRRRTAVL